MWRWFWERSGRGTERENEIILSFEHEGKGKHKGRRKIGFIDLVIGSKMILSLNGLYFLKIYGLSTEGTWGKTKNPCLCGDFRISEALTNMTSTALPFQMTSWEQPWTYRGTYSCQEQWSRWDFTLFSHWQVSLLHFQRW